MILLRRRALTGGGMPGPGPGPGGSAAGDLLVGQTVAIKESGTPIPYLVVHQGNPDAGLYDASCEGTWLLRQDINSMRFYGSSRFYPYSSMPAYLDPDISGSATYGLDEKVKNSMKVVKIPYHESSGYIMSGADGFSCKAFILGAYEYGANTDFTLPDDGAALDYFKDNNSNDRIAYYNGQPVIHWTRSDRINGSTMCVVSETGLLISNTISNSCGVRPAFILPYDYQFEESEVIA